MPGLANSDHVCLQFNLMCYTFNYTNACYKYNLCHADFNIMNHMLNNVDWINDMRLLTVDESWEHFSSTFINIMNTCIPQSKPRTYKNIYITRHAIHLKNVKTNCGSVILDLDFRLIIKHSVLLGMSCVATLDYYDITLNWVLPMTSS